MTRVQNPEAMEKENEDLAKESEGLAMPNSPADGPVLEHAGPLPASQKMPSELGPLGIANAHE
jgi:hypothetical protein